MTGSPLRFESALAEPITRFVAHKRALGRSYDTEVRTLRLFDRFLAAQNVLHLEQVTADLIEAFMASRRRQRAPPRRWRSATSTASA